MRSSILIQKRAKVLRRNLTQPEQTLWALLRRNRLGLHFRRQHALGPYVLDFYCPAAMLCVEVDGPAHSDRADRDATRDEWLLAQGIRTLRFTVDELDQRPAVVLARIKDAATPSTASGRGTPTASAGGAVGTPLPFTGEGDRAQRGGGGGTTRQGI